MLVNSIGIKFIKTEIIQSVENKFTETKVRSKCSNSLGNYCLPSFSIYFSWYYRPVNPYERTLLSSYFSIRAHRSQNAATSPVWIMSTAAMKFIPYT